MLIDEGAIKTLFRGMMTGIGKKITKITNQSTDDEYPSAKAVKDYTDNEVSTSAEELDTELRGYVDEKTVITDGSITSAKLANNSVETTKIKNGAVTENKLDSGLVEKINTKELPDVTVNDTGKVLGVIQVPHVGSDSYEWGPVVPPSSIRYIQVSYYDGKLIDNQRTITLAGIYDLIINKNMSVVFFATGTNNWIAGLFTVTNIDQWSSRYIVTVAQINNNNIYIGTQDGSDSAYLNVTLHQSNFLPQATSADEGKTAVVNNYGHWELGTPASNDFVVELTANNDLSSFTTNKTASEIYNAIEAGKNIILHCYFTAGNAHYYFSFAYFAKQPNGHNYSMAMIGSVTTSAGVACYSGSASADDSTISLTKASS